MRGGEIDAALKAARLHQEKGRLTEAEALYLKVLRARPRDVDVLQSLANVALQSGRIDIAVERLKAVLAVRPEMVLMRFNLGTALRQLGRFQEALAEHDAAIALDPQDPMLRATLWTNRGEVLRKLDRPEEAIESLDRALALRPDHAEAWICRGTIMHKRARLEEAMADFDRAIALRPKDPGIFIIRSAVLLELGRAQEALESLDEALAFSPDNAGVWNSRGNALNAIGRLDDALASFERAVALNPGTAISWNNHGKVLHDLGRADEAVESLQRALTLNPNYPEAWDNLGNALYKLGLPAEAVKNYDRAIALKPDFADAHFNRSLILLLLGRFEAAWDGYEHRKLKRSPVADRTYPQPLLSRAADARGKVVLIHVEQGIGDTIQFCRYLPMLEGLGARVLFGAPTELHALMRSLSPTVEIVGADTMPFDYHAPLMSLPRSFGTRLETIPADVPYLFAESERVARWKRRIGEEGFRIGVSWAGGATIPGRAFSPAHFMAISALPGVRLISLQKGGEAELAATPDLKIERLEGLDEGPDAFVDTASVMQSLDLVITCDTAIAHLAGALARPTWVALPHVADWRWLLDRADSPWYPTLRLFRQKARGDWGSVFAAMQAALRVRLGAEMNGSPP